MCGILPTIRIPTTTTAPTPRYRHSRHALRSREPSRGCVPSWLIIVGDRQPGITRADSALPGLPPLPVPSSCLTSPASWLCRWEDQWDVADTLSFGGAFAALYSRGSSIRHGSMQPAATMPANARSIALPDRRPSSRAVTPREVKIRQASTCTQHSMTRWRLQVSVRQSLRAHGDINKISCCYVTYRHSLCQREHDLGVVMGAEDREQDVVTSHHFLEHTHNLQRTKQRASLKIHDKHALNVTCADGTVCEGSVRTPDSTAATAPPDDSA